MAVNLGPWRGRTAGVEGPDDQARTAGTVAFSAGQAAQAGVVAALLMLASQLAWRVAGDVFVPAFPEVIVAAVARLTPVSVFGEVTETYGSLAKKTLFVTVLLAIVAVGGWAGQTAGRLTGRTGRGVIGRLLAVGLVTSGLFLVVNLVVLPIGYYGPFAVDSARTGSILVQLAVTFALFAVAWVILTGLATPAGAPAGAAPGAETTSRRAALGRGLHGTLAVGSLGAVGALTWRILTPRSTVDQAESDLAAQQIADQARATQPTPAASGGAAEAAASPPSEAAAAEPTASPAVGGGEDLAATFADLETNGRLKPVLTSVADFYRVSKNIVDPEVSEKGWTLRITGLVDTPLTFNHQQLVNRSTTKKITTLCCISNELNGDLIGTAEWQGVPLAELLAEAGVQPSVYKAKFRCSDDYEDSITLDRALDPDTLVVTGMNGELLTPDHGFPARLIVPGIYGMKNVKWVEEIELTDEDFKGYWQTRGWSDPAPYQIWGRIDFPAGGTIPPGPTDAYGVASAGDRDVSRVEVSLDDGETWADATLEPAINPPFTWVRWVFPFEAAPGKHALRIRATDGNGEVATSIARPPLPDGATGWPRRSFKVE